MPQSYTPEFKKKIVRLHEEEGRTYKSTTAEYGVSKASISKWCSEFSKECLSSPEAKEDYDNMKEILMLLFYTSPEVYTIIGMVSCR